MRVRVQDDDVGTVAENDGRDVERSRDHAAVTVASMRMVVKMIVSVITTMTSLIVIQVVIMLMRTMIMMQ